MSRSLSEFDWSSLGAGRMSDADEENESILVESAVVELRQVMRVRLLGRDPELFGAVDRHRGEVEFRLAVIPPLLALGVAAASRLGPVSGTVVVLLGVIAAGGLFVDAFERQREANDILVDALADGRVKAPSLESLEVEAASTGSRHQTDAMRKAATEFEKPLGDALRRLRSTSPGDELDRASTSVALARRRLHAIEAMFSTAAAARAAEGVVATERAIQMWQAGPQPPHEEWRSELALTLDVADESLVEFRRLGLDDVSEAGERARTETLASDGTTAPVR